MPDPIHSMTGFASLQGSADGVSWDWDIRSVNARGLDLRLRLADGFEALEPTLRHAAQAQLKRGSIALTLKLVQRSVGQDVALNAAVLDAAIATLIDITARAAHKGLVLRDPAATELLQMRGVLEQTGMRELPDGALDAAAAQITRLFAALTAMRASEGAALCKTLMAQIDQVIRIVTAARACAEARAAAAGEVLRARLKALIGSEIAADPDRLHQELALLAVKSDVTEELDRLDAHCNAAQALITAGGPVGRQLDFLMQEFNREANTLCSKSTTTELTRIGLDLKLIIDQMREQAQNLE